MKFSVRRSLLVILQTLILVFHHIGKTRSAVPLQEFFPFGSQNSDILLPIGDDNFESVPLRYPFSFFNQTYSRLFVNNNGAISFEAGVSQFTPTCGSTNIPLITPFWGDVDTRSDRGVVSYRETLDTTLIQKANREVQQAFPDFYDLSLGWLFLTTWSEVGFFGAAAREDCLGNILRNTFQLALTTDGTHSFVIIYYNKLTWTTGTASGGNCTGLGGNPAKAGFDVGDQKTFYQMTGSCTSDVLGIAERSNVGQSGKWVFRVDSALRAAPGCSNEESSRLRIKPAYVSVMGNVPITIRGPCLANVTQAACVFEDTRESRVTGIVSKDQNVVKCMLPFLSSSGRLRVDLLLTTRTGNSTYSGFIYTTDPIEDLENFRIIPEQDGAFTLSFNWNPNYFHSYANGADNPVRTKREAFDGSIISINGGVAPTLNLRTQHFDGSSWTLGEAIQLNITNTGTFSQRITPRTTERVTRSAPISADPEEQSVTATAITLDSGVDILPVVISHFFCFEAALTSPRNNLRNCLTWHRRDTGPPTGYLPCPPLEIQANEDDAFQRDTSLNDIIQFFHPGAESSFRQRVPGPTGAGSQCVYRNGQLLLGPPGGGTVDMSSPGTLRTTAMHYLNDVAPWCACCKYSNNPSACRKYYEKRPSDPGTNYVPRRPGRAVGDPHITTFDNLTYTFNGVGEYWMVQSPGFVVQARMEQFGTTQASVFTGFVLEQCNSVNETVRVQIFVKDAGQIGFFLDDELMELDASVRFNVKGLSVSFEHPGKINLDFSSGFSFIFNAGGESFLNVINSVDFEQMGKLTGLLGNYDGNPENDLTAPDGITLNPKTATLEEIHNQFGLKWIIGEPESLFRYSSGNNYSTYHNPSFVPNFNVLSLASIPEDVRAICNSSKECLFDYATTGSLAVATSTKEQVVAFEEKIEVAELQVPTCVPPKAPKNGYINATNFLLGSKIKFGCEDGFQLIGNKNVTCVNTENDPEWNGNSPVCTRRGGPSEVEDSDSERFWDFILNLYGYYKNNFAK